MSEYFYNTKIYFSFLFLFFFNISKMIMIESKILFHNFFVASYIFILNMKHKNQLLLMFFVSYFLNFLLQNQISRISQESDLSHATQFHFILASSRTSRLPGFPRIARRLCIRIHVDRN